jgi:ParB-like chromosome segregation protein Spo0J
MDNQKVLSFSSCIESKLLDEAKAIFSHIPAMDFDSQVRLVNDLRALLHEVSPFKDEPVDFVRWEASDNVQANDYNPNSVAPPEMELLRISIMSDGYTQPIVTNLEEEISIVVDGFHRSRVGKECKDVKARVNGYLPIVQIKASQADRSDRMAATIRHNRARGKHRVEAMSEIVMELKRRNWSNDRIGKELGMDPDEVLRLSQITGLAMMFADREFSEAWEHSGQEANPSIDSIESIDLEWLNGMKQDLEPGWNDRTDKNSVLIEDNGQRLGAIQHNRFDGTWNWYAYTVPMKEGSAGSLAEAKSIVETEMGKRG